jgi:hypothetical protein
MRSSVPWRTSDFSGFGGLAGLMGAPLDIAKKVARFLWDVQRRTLVEWLWVVEVGSGSYFARFRSTSQRRDVGAPVFLWDVGIGFARDVRSFAG